MWTIFWSNKWCEPWTLFATFSKIVVLVSGRMTCRTKKLNLPRVNSCIWVHLEDASVVCFLALDVLPAHKDVGKSFFVASVYQDMTSSLTSPRTRVLGFLEWIVEVPSHRSLLWSHHLLGSADRSPVSTCRRFSEKARKPQGRLLRGASFSETKLGGFIPVAVSKSC